MPESGGGSLVARGYIGIHTDTKSLPSELARAQEMFRESFKNIAEVAAGIMAAAGLKSMIDGLKEVVGGIISVNAKFETFQATLGQVFKSQAAASGMIEKLHELAGAIAMPMDTLVSATLSLRKFGFESKAIIPMLGTLADAAAMFPNSMSESMGKMVMAFSRIQASGAMTSRGMLMLFRAGIPAADILATKLHKTKAQIDAMLKAGQLTAPIAIPALLAGMKEKFGGLAENLAGTWSGLMSRLHHAWEYFLKQVGTPIFDVAKSGLKAVVDWFHSDTAKDWIYKLRSGIEYVIELIRSGMQSAWWPVVMRIGRAVLAAASFVSSIELAIVASGYLGKILSVALSPMGLLTAGAVALSYMLQQALDGPHGKELRATLSDILTIGREIGLHLMRAFGTFFSWVETKWGSTFGDMQGASDSLFGKIASGFKDALKLVATFTADFGLTWKYIGEATGLALLYLKDYVKAFEELSGAKLTLVWLQFQSAAETAFTTIRPYIYGFASAMYEIMKQIGENLKVALVNATIGARAHIQAWAETSHEGARKIIKEAYPELAKKAHGVFHDPAALKKFNELVAKKEEQQAKLREQEIFNAGGSGRLPIPGFSLEKVRSSFEVGMASAPPQTDADKKRIADREAEMKRLDDLKASPSTTDAEKELIRVRMAGILAEMNAERDKQAAAQIAKDKGAAFWAEVRMRQQPHGGAQGEGRDKMAAAGEKEEKKHKGGKEFGMVDIAQFAKDLQTSIQKAEDDKHLENMDKDIHDIAKNGVRLRNLPQQQPPQAA